MRWTTNLGYAVGLITTDGSLSIDGRHIDFTSKDIRQVRNIKKALNLSNRIGIKSSASFPDKHYFRIQFGSISLYRFLLNVGLTPNKSNSLGALKIPKRYFRDFLRGFLDGDGYTYSYWDRRWKSSFMLYLGFCSGSEQHLDWLNSQIELLYGISGRVKKGVRSYQLMLAKNASVKLLNIIYYKPGLLRLERKYSKIQLSLGIISKQAGMSKLVNEHA